MSLDPRHKKQFGVYHWDTFDNETFFKEDFDTLKEAEEYVEKEYEGRIGPHGADKVDIVDLGQNAVVLGVQTSSRKIVKQYSVG